ncbi:M16 family metallopeptidase [Streptomyces mirabilis]|uniref:M16 family metallopeptidase n=1 Tax=Streptomyces mirabilis TaxID=68239 RepID=UPI00332C06AE
MTTPPERTGSVYPVRTVHTLDNGLTVVVEEDHVTPGVAVSLCYDVGSRHERPGRTGLAHLFEHLMFQGSEHVASGEHFEVLTGLGAELNAMTSSDWTMYYEVVPVSALDMALWLEADRLGGLLTALDQVNLDNQRDVVRNERRERYDNQPYGTAYERLYAATFPEGHQYHHTPIGSMADLAAASLDDVREFFQRHYAPCNAVLSLVGDVDTEDAIKRVEKYFGGIQPGTAPPVQAPQDLGRQRNRTRIDIDDEVVPASAVHLMWRVPADGDPQCRPLQLACELLGGAMGSRLARVLVRQQGIAVEARCTLDRQVGGHSVVTLAVVGVDGTNADALLDAVTDQLMALAEEGPTSRELAAARARSEAQHFTSTTSLRGRAMATAHGQRLFGDPNYHDRECDALAEVNAADVQAAVASWLRPDDATVLTYTPAGRSGSSTKERI